MDIERLNQIGRNLESLEGRKKRKGVKPGRKSASSFRSTLHRVSEASTGSIEATGINLPELDGTETLEGLLDEIHETGEALLRDSVMGPLKEYKRSIRSFLRYILDQSIEVEDTVGIRNPTTLQQKKYVVIRIIDNKLENLAKHVLSNQADQLEILRRINEIHGLIVDLAG